jgi:hypothetical protein
MAVRHRLQRLEARVCKEGGRCRLCRDRPGQVLVVRRDGEPRAKEQQAESAEAIASCPACGWQPDVVQITEVLIHSRAQWAQFRNREHPSQGP